MVKVNVWIAFALAYCASLGSLPVHADAVDGNESESQVEGAPWTDSHRETAKKLSLEKKKALAVEFVRKQVETYGIPGVALSVVVANKTMIAQGFGTREYGNPKNVVTKSTLFEIASVTKTFISLAIAKLADDKLLSWNDPVKKHLPWFQLVDKYAEQYTTLGDLASMNSVIGSEADLPWAIGLPSSEKQLVESLKYLETSREFRAGYHYANMNFEVLGQVIEAKTNQTWHAYLNKTFWQPLDMKSTVARPQDARNLADLSYGHFYCGKKVAGPFNSVNSTALRVDFNGGYIAEGSIYSSAEDLATFSHFLLSKGAGIFKSPEAISTMTTGHVIGSYPPQDEFAARGYTYQPDGNAVAAGYGFDIAGDVMFGQHYYGKVGDSAAFRTRAGYLPDKNISVVLLSNAQAQGGRPSADSIVDLMRTYIFGLFLDVPVAQLDREFRQTIETLDKKPAAPCNPYVFDGKSYEDPSFTIPPETMSKLLGTYSALVSPGYFGYLSITSENKTKHLVLQYGAATGRLYPTQNPTTLIWASDLFPVQVSWTDLNAANPVITWGGFPFAKV